MALLKTNKFQILLRQALLDLATSETKNKFTGKGYGENKVLRDDAEELICTIMRLIAARRSNEIILVGDTEYKSSEYPTIKGGAGQMMEWNGYAYITSSDHDHHERSLVKVDFPEYEKDKYSYDGDLLEAGGRVVSPKRFETLIESFNAKQNSHNKLTCGQALAIGDALLSEVGYMYFDKKIRRIGDGAKVGQEMATLLKPRFAGSGIEFGSQSDVAAEETIKQWLFATQRDQE